MLMMTKFNFGVLFTFRGAKGSMFEGGVRTMAVVGGGFVPLQARGNIVST